MQRPSFSQIIFLNSIILEYIFARNWKHRFVYVGIPTTMMRKGLEKVNTGLRTVLFSCLRFLLTDLYRLFLRKKGHCMGTPGCRILADPAATNQLSVPKF